MPLERINGVEFQFWQSAFPLHQSDNHIRNRLPAGHPQGLSDKWGILHRRLDEGRKCKYCTGSHYQEMGSGIAAYNTFRTEHTAPFAANHRFLCAETVSPP